MTSSVNIQGPAAIIFPFSNGINPVYLEESVYQFKTEAQKTDSAYTMHIPTNKTDNISKIIDSGRLALLKIKDGKLQGILIHSKLQLYSDVTKFIIKLRLNEMVYDPFFAKS